MYPYQVGGVLHQLEFIHSMLWVDMGRGKTIITLTTILELMDMVKVYGVLVVAPLRVCQAVWQQEAKKWDHTKDIKFSFINGSQTQRHRSMRIRADIYLINYESIPWLADELVDVYLSRGKYLPFNCVVFDEVTKMKNAETNRHTSFRDLMPYIPYRMGLTGKPSPNGYKDLFGQYLAVDGGDRLGISKSDYVEEHFNEEGYGGTQLVVKEGHNSKIKKKISDMTFRVAQGEMKSLPPLTINDIILTLDPKIQKKYDLLEEEMFIEMDSGVGIEVVNKASLWNKCLQAASGALYVEAGMPGFEVLHKTKLNALGSIIGEAGGEPMLVLYAYTHDRHRIVKEFPNAEFFESGMSSDDVQDLVSRWNLGKIEVLLGHPASMGHGLNMQFGGHTIVWYGLNINLELYEQAIARILRDGQTEAVMMHRILCANTLDMVVDIRLKLKTGSQNELLDTINDYRMSK